MGRELVGGAPRVSRVQRAFLPPSPSALLAPRRFTPSRGFYWDYLVQFASLTSRTVKRRVKSAFNSPVLARLGRLPHSVERSASRPSAMAAFCARKPNAANTGQQSFSYRNAASAPFFAAPFVFALRYRRSGPMSLKDKIVVLTGARLANYV
jgi:hypothetical protein